MTPYELYKQKMAAIKAKHEHELLHGKPKKFKKRKPRPVRPPSTHQLNADHLRAIQRGA